MCGCSSDLKFQYIIARWPGNVHGARVLRNSTLYEHFSNKWLPFRNAVLLGDSCYPLMNFLITPILHPVTEAELQFNRSHKSTRCMIENSFACLKERFACFKYLRVNDPTFACQIIKCCAILHNICGNNKCLLRATFKPSFVQLLADWCSLSSPKCSSITMYVAVIQVPDSTSS